MNETPNLMIRKRITQIPAGHAVQLDGMNFYEAFPGEHYSNLDIMALAVHGHKTAESKTSESQAREFAQANGLEFFMEPKPNGVFATFRRPQSVYKPNLSTEPPIQ